MRRGGGGKKKNLAFNRPWFTFSKIRGKNVVRDQEEATGDNEKEERGEKVGKPTRT